MSVDSNNSAYLESVGGLWPTLTTSSRITVGYRYTRRASTQSTGTVASAYAGGGDPLNAAWWIRHTGSAIVFGYGDGASQTYATYTFTEIRGPHTVVCMFDYANDARKMYYDGKDVTASLSDTGAWTLAPGTTQTYRNLFGGRSINGDFHFCDFPIEDFWFAESALPGIAGAAALFHIGADPPTFCVPARWLPLRDLAAYDAALKTTHTIGDRTGLKMFRLLKPSPPHSALFNTPGTPPPGGGARRKLLLYDPLELGTRGFV